MGRPDDELAEAARAMEEELQRFENLADQAGSSPLRTRKHLERAAKSLQAVADSDERLNARVAVLSQALQKARERKEEKSRVIAEAAQRLQARTEQYQALMGRFGELGQRASNLSQTARDKVAAKDPDALRTVQQELGELAARTDALSKEAQELDFEDVSRDAAGLRHELLQTKNALKLHSGGDDALPS